jgi:hypothetical protein
MGNDPAAVNYDVATPGARHCKNNRSAEAPPLHLTKTTPAGGTRIFAKIQPPPASNAVSRQTRVAFFLDQPALAAHKTRAMVPRTVQSIRGSNGNVDGPIPIRRPQATAAPATVCGECWAICHWETGKAAQRIDPQARRPALHDVTQPRRV